MPMRRLFVHRQVGIYRMHWDSQTLCSASDHYHPQFVAFSRTSNPDAGKPLSNMSLETVVYY